ncbi:MAG: M24 family metallopeptidase [Desulfobacca sp.]|uniref:M24 family metallopeptidase n=1 Tax=Desulfobacca sp. TaxID=2067990 RepID=UPI0040498DA1
MTPAVYQNRLTALRALLQEQGLDGLLVSCPENRRYLSGFSAADSHLQESSGFLLINQEAALLLTDFRYREWAQAEAPLFEVRSYTSGMAKLLAELLGQLGLGRVGFEAPFLTYATYQKIVQEAETAGLQVAWQPLDQLVEQLRAIKDPEEISLIRRSLAITERVMVQVGATLRVGLTEAEVAWRLEQALRQAGAERPSFPPMVAAGPNAARPHHHPGERQLQTGEAIIIDMGAVYQGYCSDMTRTFYLGEPDARFKEVYTIVRRAQLAAEAGIRAGMSTAAADGLAREIIATAGYGEAFGHSLGHGVGLAVHEHPSLSPVQEKAVPLQAGMVTTVEPGIYLPGWGGVRLEDMVLIQAEGARLLNQDRTFYQFD